VKRLRRGQSLVELALLVPIMIAIVLGIIECSYYLYSYSALENATRRASEWAFKSPPYTVTSSDDDTADKCAVLIKQAAMEGIVLHTLEMSNIEITFPVEQVREIGSQVEVRLRYTTTWLTPLGRQFFGPALNFDFTSRRTIGNTTPPTGLNEDCS
jgi:hypothetical protein